MSIGPIQVFVFGFDSTDKLKGEALQELFRLRTRGIVRIIDIMFAKKEADGQIRALEMEGLTPSEKAELGSVVRGLIGKGATSPTGAQAVAKADLLDASLQSVGLSIADFTRALEALPVGKAIAVLILEHTWAGPFRDALRKAGGVPLTQGYLTAEALQLVGREIQAVTEAEQSIELAEAIKGVAVLDILATMEAADRMKTAIAADVLRTLVVAQMIEEEAVDEAIDTLVAAGYIEEQARLQASQRAAEQAK
ncbi:MAG: hypothetical protein MUO23_08100 [Anaerolineales bacterium]|nr:hypothetical protein [Anaerolineales bacterium]